MDTKKTKITVKKQREAEKTLEQVFHEVTMLNGEETEDGINMAIAQELVQERKRQSILENSITKLESEEDSGKQLNNGVYVYQYEDLYSWSFKRYNTMAEAVRAAVLMIDAIILYNGTEIIYDALSNEDAYYIDNDTNKVMLIKL